MNHRILAALLAAACTMTAAPAFAKSAAGSQGAGAARDMYNRAMAQERVVLDDASTETHPGCTTTPSTADARHHEDRSGRTGVRDGPPQRYSSHRPARWD